MKNTRAFYDIPRQSSVYRPVEERKLDFKEVERPLDRVALRQQAERCMDCGVPFCHGAGCPLGNVIPEINALAYHDKWREAWAMLAATSPFPEFTSRICPALCESACCAGISGSAVMVRQIEKAVVERAFDEGWVTPPFPENGERGRSVAVVGAGPAGLAAAVKLRKLGYAVTVYDAGDAPGGLLRYGIPEFKLDKTVIDRRVALLIEAGIRFVTASRVGQDIAGRYLQNRYDAVLVTSGTPEARELPIPGRELTGIYPALAYLHNPALSARGKKVLVIGGGDTGSDCVGTAVRQQAASVLQIEIMPEPPAERSASTPWPQWPYLLRTSSSHLEGGHRRWALASRRFLGADGRLTGMEVEKVAWQFSPEGRPLKFEAVPDSVEKLDCDLVFLALGFLRHDRAKVLGGLLCDENANTFIAGDAANGPSLVVRAIADALRVSDDVDQYLR